MSTKETCRTCQHCALSKTKADGWCRLRQITVPHEISLVAFCHHWVQKAPALPRFKEDQHQPSMDLQLEFNRVFVGTDRQEG